MKFSTALDSFRTDMAALFPTKTELVNPYNPEDNSDTFLRNGYGISLGGSEEVNTATTFRVADHDVVILLSKEILKTENNPDPVYTTARDLKNDSLLICQEFLCKNMTGISKIIYSGDSAVELITDDKFMIMTVTLTMTVFEEL